MANVAIHVSRECDANAAQRSTCPRGVPPPRRMAVTILEWPVRCRFISLLRRVNASQNGSSWSGTSTHSAQGDTSSRAMDRHGVSRWGRYSALSQRGVSRRWHLFFTTQRSTIHEVSARFLRHSAPDHKMTTLTWLDATTHRNSQCSVFRNLYVRTKTSTGAFGQSRGNASSMTQAP